MSAYIQNNQEVDGRAAAALGAEAGLERAEAERLTAILRTAGVLRSAIGLRSATVSEGLGRDPYVELDFENGKRLAGHLRNDFEAIPAWSNPFLDRATP